MRILFNCSCIKNVFLRLDSDVSIEMEITYLDDNERNWLYRKTIKDLAHKEHQKNKLASAYNTIKKALMDGEKFIEIEL